MLSLKKSNFKFFIILTVFLLIGYLIKVCFFASESVPKYITATVERGDLERTVLADGTIKAFKQVSVGAQVSGQIKKLYVELGDEVKKGDLIAEIDDLTQNNNLKQAQAALESLEAQRKAKMANLVNNQLTYDRQLKLVNRGAGAQSDLDAALAQLDAIKAEIVALDANIVSAQIAVDTANVNLGYTKITSPMDGVIVAIPVEAGQTVNSVQSAPTIVKVAQLDKMTIEAQISEADVINVAKGMNVYFTILGLPDKRFDGLTLRAIEPAPDSINTETSTTSSSATTAIYYHGLFDVDNPEHLLRISMTAQVYIILAQAKDVLYIPSMAITQKLPNNKAKIYILDDKQNVIEKEIEIGLDNGVNVELKVSSGLKQGDTLIISRMDGGSLNKVSKPRSLRF
ncbi:efflux RND transporter periplasmic adaptor subunit [Orbaceae bacterium ac157xtp]